LIGEGYTPHITLGMFDCSAKYFDLLLEMRTFLHNTSKIIVEEIVDSIGHVYIGEDVIFRERQILNHGCSKWAYLAIVKNAVLENENENYTGLALNWRDSDSKMLHLETIPIQNIEDDRVPKVFNFLLEFLYQYFKSIGVQQDLYSKKVNAINKILTSEIFKY